jgi:hypothetical protein
MRGAALAGRLADPADALRFLVEFAQLDLAQLPMRKLRECAWGVQLFLNRETPGYWTEKAAADRVFLQAVQDRARSLLQLFVQSRAAVEGDLLLTFAMTRNEDGRVHVYVHGSPLDRFLYQAVRVMETGGAEKLLACPASGCGRLFSKVTKKRFCSTRCQSRTYMRAKRAADREADRDALTSLKGERNGLTTRKK